VEIPENITVLRIYSRRKNMKKRFGFTLIELLVVISIIGILVAIGVVSYSSANRKSRDTKRMSDIEQIRSALEMYRSDNGTYPTGNEVSVASGITGLSSYLPSAPDDPKPASYHYYYTVTNSNYGYCLSAYVENASLVVDKCTAFGGNHGGYNYFISNP
jgi:type II secretion system protein G